jgi:hypothetical protein
VMDHHQIQPAMELAAILNADEAARISAATEIRKLAKPAALPA